MISTDTADQAAFYRAALYLGLVRGETVIAWADAVFDASPTPERALLELTMTPADDLTALRHALLPLSGEALAPAVVAMLLELIGRQWRTGERSFADTITVLSQLRNTRLLDAPLAEELRQLEFRFRAAASGDTSDLESELRQWLTSYAEPRHESRTRRNTGDAPL